MPELLLGYATPHSSVILLSLSELQTWNTIPCFIYFSIDLFVKKSLLFLSKHHTGAIIAAAKSSSHDYNASNSS